MAPVTLADLAEEYNTYIRKTIKTLSDLCKKIDNSKALYYKDVQDALKILPAKTCDTYVLLPSSETSSKLGEILSIAAMCSHVKDKLVGFANDSCFPSPSSFLFMTFDGKIVKVFIDTDKEHIKDKLQIRYDDLYKEMDMLVKIETIDYITFHLPALEGINLNSSSPYQKQYEVTRSISESTLEDELVMEKVERFLEDYSKGIEEISKADIKEYTKNYSKLAYLRPSAQRNDLWDDYQLLQDIKNDTSSYSDYTINALKYIDALILQSKEIATRKWMSPFELPSIDHESKSVEDQMHYLQKIPIIRALSTIKASNSPDMQIVTKDFQLLDFEGQFSEDDIMAAKYIEDNTFKIIWNKSSIDDNFHDSIGRKKLASHKKLAQKKELREKFFLEDFLDSEKVSAEEIYQELKTFETDWMCDVGEVESSPVSLYKKLQNMCLLAEKEQMSLDQTATDWFRDVAKESDTNMFANLISYEYEIAKAASITMNGLRKENYYKIIKIPGYNSVIIRTCNSTLDSFQNMFLMPLYEKQNVKNMNMFARKALYYEGKWATGHSHSYNRNSLCWALKKPVTYLSFATWLYESHLSFPEEKKIQHMIRTAYSITNTNRDSFSGSSQQLRYLFMSTTGLSSNPSSTLKKLDKYIPKTKYETRYLFNMIKMSITLQEMKTKNMLKEVYDTDGEEAHIFKVAMPHDIDYVTDYNYIVSSFYICNIYNKYKYDVESSESICYESLLEENEIYLNAKDNYYNEWSGFSDEVMSSKVTEFSEIMIDYYNAELEFALGISRLSGKRYCNSTTLILCASLSKRSKSTLRLDMLHDRLTENVVGIATTKGGMSGEGPTAEPQSVRSATVILEGVLKSRGLSADEFNAGSWKQQEISDITRFNSASILTCVLLSYNIPVQYAYRIVHKDQVMHREISVLNYHMRVGSKFIENISRALTEMGMFPQNFLNRSDRSETFQNMVLSSRKKNDTARNMSILFDNADQKRWGPNSKPSNFYSMLHVMTLGSFEGLSRLTADVLIKFDKKIAKFPERLVEWAISEKDFRRGTTVGRVLDTIKSHTRKNEFGLQFEWGMCQGILHETSSIYHVLSNTILERVLRTAGAKSVETMITSDDSFRVIQYPIPAFLERPEFIHEMIADHYTSIMSRVLSAFNILRSPNKSTLNRYFAEFNSEFFMSYKMYVPSLKQRIAKIDVGEANDPVDDLVSMLSSVKDAYNSGLSFLGTTALFFLNLLMWMEQWRKWYLFKETDMSKSNVLDGGLPYLSVFALLMGNALTSCILSFKREMPDFSQDHKLNKVIEQFINLDMEEVSQQELLRGNSTVPKDFTFSYLSPVSISGMVSLVKPNQKASRFLRRHKLQNLVIRPDTVLLTRNDSSIGTMMLALKSGVGSKKYEGSIGTNSFFVKFSEAYISLDSKKFRVSKKNIGTFLNSEYGNYMSLRELEESYKRRTFFNEISKLNSTPYDKFSSLVLEISKRIRNVEKMSNYYTNVSFLSLTKKESPGFRHIKAYGSVTLTIDKDDAMGSTFYNSYMGPSKVILMKSDIYPSDILDMVLVNVPQTEDIEEAYNRSIMAMRTAEKYANNKTNMIVKARDTADDTELYYAVAKSIAYNFSTMVSYEVQTSKFPVTGIRKSTRLLSLPPTRFEYNQEEVRSIVKSIFQERDYRAKERYLTDTKNSNVLDHIPLDFIISEVPVRTKFVVNHAKLIKARDVIRVLSRFGNRVSLGPRVLLNKSISDIFLRGSWLYSKDRLLSVRPERSGPVKMDDVRLYVIESKGSTYVHHIFVDDSKRSLIGREAEVTIKNKRYTEKGMKTEIKEIVVDRSRKFTMSDTDSVQFHCFNEGTSIIFRSSTKTLTRFAIIDGVPIATEPYSVKVSENDIERYKDRVNNRRLKSVVRTLKDLVEETRKMIIDSEGVSRNKSKVQNLMYAINRVSDPATREDVRDVIEKFSRLEFEEPSSEFLRDEIVDELRDLSGTDAVSALVIFISLCAPNGCLVSYFFNQNGVTKHKDVSFINQGLYKKMEGVNQAVFESYDRDGEDEEKDELHGDRPDAVSFMRAENEEVMDDFEITEEKINIFPSASNYVRPVDSIVNSLESSFGIQLGKGTAQVSYVKNEDEELKGKENQAVNIFDSMFSDSDDDDSDECSMDINFNFPTEVKDAGNVGLNEDMDLGSKLAGMISGQRDNEDESAAAKYFVVHRKEKNLLSEGGVDPFSYASMERSTRTIMYEVFNAVVRRAVELGVIKNPNTVIRSMKSNMNIMVIVFETAKEFLTDMGAAILIAQVLSLYN